MFAARLRDERDERDDEVNEGDAESEDVRDAMRAARCRMPHGKVRFWVLKFVAARSNAVRHARTTHDQPARRVLPEHVNRRTR
jgi:hypothetical protein